ncbi:MAG: hypothetical protein V4689_14300 [Verrucomicrobiota bacterium]
MRMRMVMGPRMLGQAFSGHAAALGCGLERPGTGWDFAVNGWQIPQDLALGILIWRIDCSRKNEQRKTPDIADLNPESKPGWKWHPGVMESANRASSLAKAAEKSEDLSGWKCYAGHYRTGT